MKVVKELTHCDQGTEQILMYQKLRRKTEEEATSMQPDSYR